MNFDKYWKLGVKIFPICRSLSGPGNRLTLKLLKNANPEIKIKSVPSGKNYFDWTTPPEWQINSAYIEEITTKKKNYRF